MHKYLYKRGDEERFWRRQCHLDDRVYCANDCSETASKLSYHINSSEGRETNLAPTYNFASQYVYVDITEHINAMYLGPT